MKITVTVRHTEVPPLAEEMLRKKAEKLERFGHHDLISLHAIFDKQKYLYTSELQLTIKGGNLVGKDSHDSDLLTCIEGAIEKLETQLKRREDKQIDEARRRTPHRPA